MLGCDSFGENPEKLQYRWNYRSVVTDQVSVGKVMWKKMKAKDKINEGITWKTVNGDWFSPKCSVTSWAQVLVFNCIWTCTDTIYIYIYTRQRTKINILQMWSKYMQTFKVIF